MLPGARFAAWIAQYAFGWRLPVGEWIGEWLGKGITKAFEDMEPGAIASFKDAITKIRDNPLTPPEMVTFYNKALVPGNWLTELVAGLTMAIGAIPALLGAGVPLGNLITYAQDKELRSYRVDPIAVITALRRDPEKYAYLKDDLREQGWSEERIEALEFYTRVMPSPRDYVGFLAHEVFEKDMIAKYGLLSEWDKIDKEPAKKIGLLEEILQLYWMDHWEHPEWGTIRELRHRDQITDQDVQDWFRIVEIPEYWRPKMLNVLWGLPNRIEIRMMARYLDMSKEEIMDLLKKAGLHEDFRADAADFMMIMGLTGYWSDMLRGGWMSPEEVKADIDTRGFKPITAERIYKRLVKADQPERTATERDITKTDIIKGVKTGVITRGEGEELLMDIGYSYDEAVYILEINIPLDEEDAVVKERELSKTDIKVGIAKEILSRDEARSKLLELRYKPADVEFLLDIYEVVAKPPVEPRLKEASKADIMLGVKKGLITQEEGYGMLLDIDFTPEAASFILMVKTEESPFSPINYGEFKNVTQLWRRSAGLEAKPMTEEIKKAGEEVVRITGEVETLNRAIEEERRGLVEEEVLPEEATVRLEELQVKRNRAEAELQHVKLEYDRLVAEWRHGESET